MSLRDEYNATKLKNDENSLRNIYRRQQEEKRKKELLLSGTARSVSTPAATNNTVSTQSTSKKITDEDIEALKESNSKARNAKIKAAIPYYAQRLLTQNQTLGGTATKKTEEKYNDAKKSYETAHTNLTTAQNIKYEQEVYAPNAQKLQGDSELNKLVDDYISSEKKAGYTGDVARFLSMTGNAGKVIANVVNLATLPFGKEANDTRKKIIQGYGYTDEEFNNLIDTAKRQLNAQRTEDLTEKLKEQNSTVPGAVLNTIGSLGKNLSIGGTTAATIEQAIENKITGTYKPIDVNSDAFYMTNYSDITRGQIASDLSEKHGELAGNLYQLGMSVADNAAQQLTLGKLSRIPGMSKVGRAAVLGAMADDVYSSAVNETIRNGGTNADAITAGITKAGIETLTELIPTDHIMKWSNGELTGSLFKKFTEQMFEEGTEEVASDVLNYLVSNFQNGGVNDIEKIAREYEKSGMSEYDAFDQAKKDWLGDLAKDFAGGALSGGVMGGAATAVNAVANTVDGKKIANNTQQKAEIIERGLMSDDAEIRAMAEDLASNEDLKNFYNTENSSISELALANRDDTGKLSDRKLGKLANAVNLEAYETSIAEKKKAESGIERAINLFKSDNMTKTAKENGTITAEQKINPQKTIQSIAEVNGDEVKVTIDGKSVPLSSASFSNEEQAQVYNNITKNDFDTQAAQVYVDCYNEMSGVNGENMNPKLYQVAFYDAYSAGYYGREMNGDASILPEPIIQRAFEQGQRKYSLVHDEFISSQVKKSSGGVISNYQSVPTSQQMREIDFIDSVAKAFNIPVVIDESISKADGETANGYYADGSIHLALNDIDRAMSVTFMHETAHFVQDLAPEHAKALENFVISELNKKGVNTQEIIDKKIASYKKQGVDLSRQAAIDEIVAESVPVVLQDEQSVNHLINENRSLAEKIKDFLKDFLANIKNLLSTSYTKQFEGDIESIRTIYNLLEKGLKEAKNNTVTKSEGVAKLSLQSYKDNVDLVMENKYHSDNLVHIGSMPYRLHDILGVPRLPMYISPKHIYTMAASEQQAKREGRFDKNSHYHDLGVDFLKRLPDVLDKPQMIIKSNTDKTDATFIVVTNEVDNKGNPIIAAIKPMGNARYFNINFISPILLSGYGKDNFNSYFNKAYNENRILYVFENKKSSRNDFKGRFQSPTIKVSSNYLDNNLAQFKKVVNSNIRQNSKKDTKFSLKDSRYDNAFEGREKAMLYRTVKSLELNNEYEYGDIVCQLIDTDNELQNEKLVVLEADIDGELQYKNVYLLENSDYNIHEENEVVNTIIELEKGGFTNAGFNKILKDISANGKEPICRRYINESRRFSRQLNGNSRKSLQPLQSDVKKSDGRRSVKADVNNEEKNGNIKSSFSLKNADKIVRQIKRTKSEDKLIEYLAETFNQQTSVEFDKTAINKFARDFIKQNYSKYNYADLSYNLELILKNSKNMETEEMVGLVAQAFMPVYENSEVADDGLATEYGELRKLLTTTKVSLNDVQKAELRHTLGSNWRREIFGKINLKNNAISLDSFYQELSGSYPEFFDKDLNSNEQALKILEVLDALQPEVHNPFDFSGKIMYEEVEMPDGELAYMEVPPLTVEEQAVMSAYEFLTYSAENIKAYNAFTDTNETKIAELQGEIEKVTNEKEQALSELKLNEFATKRQADKLVAKYDNDIDRLNKKISRLEEENKQVKAEYRQKIKDLRQSKNERIETNKAKYQQRIKDLRQSKNESANRNRYKIQITAEVSRLVSAIENPTDTNKIPESLKKPLVEMLGMIDFGKSKKAYEWQAKLNAFAAKLTDDGTYRDDTVYFDFAPDLKEFLSLLAEKGSINKLDVNEMRVLRNVISSIRTTVTQANQMLANAKYQEVSQLGNDTISELIARKRKEKVGLIDEYTNFDMLNAYTYGHTLGSAGRSVFNAIDQGQNEYIFKREIYQKACEDIKKKHNIKLKKLESADVKNGAINVRLDSGENVVIPRAYAMELYELSKRKEAQGHLLGQGIRLKSTKANRSDSKQYKITPNDLRKITNELTEGEKNAANEMQQFLSSVCSEWNNHTSMKMYGQKRFTSPDYYPMKVDGTTTRTTDKNKSNANGGLYAIKNYGWTKSVTPKAKNALMIGSIFDTFIEHANQSAIYGSFAIPLQDAMKWYNYHNKENSVQGAMLHAMGKNGLTYFTNLIEDINGVGGKSAQNSVSKLMGKFTAKMKVASVAANLRVAIQQPTAYTRAAAVMDAKYLVKPSNARILSGAKKAKEYCAIAKWKSWGYYTTDVSQDLKSQLFGAESFKDKLVEKSLILAEKGDEWTWGMLWNACENEIKDTHKDLKAGSNEFNKAVAERLSDVIHQTQVVDSVLDKAQIMRRGSDLTKMVTSFMNEPIKTYNVEYRAIYDLKLDGSKENKQKLVKATTSLVVTAVMTSVAAALMDALRKDDKDKEFYQKYLEALTGVAIGEDKTAAENLKGFILDGTLGDNLNPLTVLPYFSELWSLVQGYDVDRMDMTGLSGVVKSVQSIYKLISSESKDTTAWYKAAYNITKSLSQLTGIPVSNFWRDSEAIVETATGKSMQGNADMSYYGYSMYESLLDKDMKSYNATKEKLIGYGKSDTTIENAVIKTIVEHDDRITKAAQAFVNGDKDEYLSYMQQVIAEGVPTDYAIKAMNKAKKNIANIDDPFADDSVSTKSIYSVSMIAIALNDGDIDEAQAVTEDIISEILNDSENYPKIKTRQQAVARVKQSLSSKYKGYYQLQYLEKGRAGTTALRQNLVKLRLGFTSSDIVKWQQEADKMTQEDIEKLKEKYSTAN